MAPAANNTTRNPWNLARILALSLLVTSACVTEATNKFANGVPSTQHETDASLDADVPDFGADRLEDETDTTRDDVVRDAAQDWYEEPIDLGRTDIADIAADLSTDDGDVSVDPLTPEIVRIVVLSDLNGSYGSTTYREEVHSGVLAAIELEPDIVLSAGDMVAGQKSGLDYRAMWDAFHGAVSDPLEAAGIPFAVTPGNHDASGYASYADERAIYVDEWLSRWPDVDFLDASDYPLRYSFTSGPALFISLDATTVGSLSANQVDWIEQQLIDGDDYPVKIVYGHLPLYPFTEGRETEVIGDPNLEALLVDYDVTAFISGHHHAYYPGRRGDLRLVGTACLGDSPRRLIGDETTSKRSILLLEVSSEGIDILEAFTGSDFDIPIARESLPAKVGTGSSEIVRDDL